MVSLCMWNGETRKMSTTELFIADYLKRHGHTKTLSQFEKEAGFNHEDINYEPLETIVDDKIKFIQHHEITKNSDGKINDLVANKELFVDDTPDDLESDQLKLKELPEFKALVIHISHGELILDSKSYKVLIITSNDKKTTVWDITNEKILMTMDKLHTSVGKCTYLIPRSNRFISCGMDGIAKLYEIKSFSTNPELVDQIHLHKRLIIDIVIWQSEEDVHVYSIGWDGFLKCCLLSNDKFIHKSEFKLLSIPTGIIIGSLHNEPIIFVTRLDSTQLFIFTYKSQRIFEISRVSLNDAEFSSHGFTPMSMSLSSDIIQEDTYIAIGTSHIPYMRVIITKIPFLDIEKLDPTQPFEQQLTSVEISRGLIIGNYSTSSPQDKYSQGVVHWKDNSKIWVSGDDGNLRLLNLYNGQVSVLQGHEQRIKSFINISGQDVMFSSGIDKKLLCWK